MEKIAKPQIKTDQQQEQQSNQPPPQKEENQDKEILQDPESKKYGKII